LPVLLKILAFVFIAPGFALTLAAKGVVSRFKLDLNAKCDFEHEMGEEELKQYKFNKTVVNAKMLGMLIALPGLILLILAFR